MRGKAVSLGLLLLWPGSGWADALSPGSDASPCHNMLAPGGMTRCQPKAPVSESPLPQQPASPAPARTPGMVPLEQSPARMPIGGVAEEAVDEYLASYGKPPREAVRALLNPTEENIAAMEAQEKRRQIVAAYVAERWYDLKQRNRAQSEKATLAAYTILPFFVGMQITLYLTPDCQPCEAAVAVLKQVVEENPVADARLVVITDSPRGALDALLRLGVSLPVATLSPREARASGVDRVPAIDITDTRSHRWRRLAGVPDAAALRAAVVALRKARQAEQPPAPNGAESSSAGPR